MVIKLKLDLLSITFLNFFQGLAGAISCLSLSLSGDLCKGIKKKKQCTSRIIILNGKRDEQKELREI